MSDGGGHGVGWGPNAGVHVIDIEIAGPLGVLAPIAVHDAAGLTLLILAYRWKQAEYGPAASDVPDEGSVVKEKYELSPATFTPLIMALLRK